jgi:predicted nucleic acid-binding Zn ribbon protein
VPDGPPASPPADDPRSPSPSGDASERGTAVPGDRTPDPSAPSGQNHDPTGTDLARAVAGRVKARRRSLRRAAPTSSQRVSGVSPEGRDPRLLAAALDGLVDEQDWRSPVSVHGVFGRWDQIVGPEVATHCRPEAFRDGELTVRADSTAWATQVRLLAGTLLRRLNEELGPDTISKVVVRPPDSPSWRRGFRTIRGSRGPRDTYG